MSGQVVVLVRGPFAARDHKRGAGHESQEREFRHAHPETINHCSKKGAEHEHEQESQGATDGMWEPPDHASDGLTGQSTSRGRTGWPPGARYAAEADV